MSKEIGVEGEDEAGEEEVKQKCVDIKVSLRSSLLDQELHDVTLCVTVEPPLCAHLGTRSFMRVGKL